MPLHRSPRPSRPARSRRDRPRRGTAALAVLVLLAVCCAACSSGSSGSSSPTTTTVAPAPPGGSGNTSPSAVTTSADCPASFTATLNKPSYPAAPPMTIDPSKTYTVTVTTDVGTFTATLDPKTAPQTVNSFVFLADHHFYDCIIFHRVIQTFMDQTGDPTGTGDGGPGYTIPDEFPPAASNGADQYPVGSLAMANTGQPHSGGSQFFIVTGPEGQGLSPDYTLFGQVTSGMDVVQRINADGASSTSSQGTPAVLHRMVSVTVTVS